MPLLREYSIKIGADTAEFLKELNSLESITQRKLSSMKAFDPIREDLAELQDSIIEMKRQLKSATDEINKSISNIDATKMTESFTATSKEVTKSTEDMALKMKALQDSINELLVKSPNQLGKGMTDALDGISAKIEIVNGQFKTMNDFINDFRAGSFGDIIDVKNLGKSTNDISHSVQITEEKVKSLTSTLNDAIKKLNSFSGGRGIEGIISSIDEESSLGPIINIQNAVQNVIDSAKALSKIEGFDLNKLFINNDINPSVLEKSVLPVIKTAIKDVSEDVNKKGATRNNLMLRWKAELEPSTTIAQKVNEVIKDVEKKVNPIKVEIKASDHGTRQSVRDVVTKINDEYRKSESTESGKAPQFEVGVGTGSNTTNNTRNTVSANSINMNSASIELNQEGIATENTLNDIKTILSSWDKTGLPDQNKISSQKQVQRINDSNMAYRHLISMRRSKNLSMNNFGVDNENGYYDSHYGIQTRYHIPTREELARQDEKFIERFNFLIAYMDAVKALKKSPKLNDKFSTTFKIDDYYTKQIKKDEKGKEVEELIPNKQYKNIEEAKEALISNILSSLPDVIKQSDLFSGSHKIKGETYALFGEGSKIDDYQKEIIKTIIDKFNGNIKEYLEDLLKGIERELTGKGTNGMFDGLMGIMRSNGFSFDGYKIKPHNLNHYDINGNKTNDWRYLDENGEIKLQSPPAVSVRDTQQRVRMLQEAAEERLAIQDQLIKDLEHEKVLTSEIVRLNDKKQDGSISESEEANLKAFEEEAKSLFINTEYMEEYISLIKEKNAIINKENMTPEDSQRLYTEINPRLKEIENSSVEDVLQVSIDKLKDIDDRIASAKQGFKDLISETRSAMYTEYGFNTSSVQLTKEKYSKALEELEILRQQKSAIIQQGNTSQKVDKMELSFINQRMEKLKNYIELYRNVKELKLENLEDTSEFEGTRKFKTDFDISDKAKETLGEAVSVMDYGFTKLSNYTDAELESFISRLRDVGTELEKDESLVEKAESYASKKVNEDIQHYDERIQELLKQFQDLSNKKMESKGTENETKYDKDIKDVLFKLRQYTDVKEAISSETNFNLDQEKTKLLEINAEYEKQQKEVVSISKLGKNNFEGLKRVLELNEQIAKAEQKRRDLQKIMNTKTGTPEYTQETYLSDKYLGGKSIQEVLGYGYDIDQVEKLNKQLESVYANYKNALALGDSNRILYYQKEIERLTSSIQELDSEYKKINIDEINPDSNYSVIYSEEQLREELSITNKELESAMAERRRILSGSNKTSLKGVLSQIGYDISDDILKENLVNSKNTVLDASQRDIFSHIQKIDEKLVFYSKLSQITDESINKAYDSLEKGSGISGFGFSDSEINEINKIAGKDLSGATLSITEFHNIMANVRDKVESEIIPQLQSTKAIETDKLKQSLNKRFIDYAIKINTIDDEIATSLSEIEKEFTNVGKTFDESTFNHSWELIKKEFEDLDNKRLNPEDRKFKEKELESELEFYEKISQKLAEINKLRGNRNVLDNLAKLYQQFISSGNSSELNEGIKQFSEEMITSNPSTKLSQAVIKLMELKEQLDKQEARIQSYIEKYGEISLHDARFENYKSSFMNRNSEILPLQQDALKAAQKELELRQFNKEVLDANEEKLQQIIGGESKVGEKIQLIHAELRDIWAMDDSERESNKETEESLKVQLDYYQKINEQIKEFAQNRLNAIQAEKEVKSRIELDSKSSRNANARINRNYKEQLETKISEIQEIDNNIAILDESLNKLKRPQLSVKNKQKQALEEKKQLLLDELETIKSEIQLQKDYETIRRNIAEEYSKKKNIGIRKGMTREQGLTSYAIDEYLKKSSKSSDEKEIQKYANIIKEYQKEAEALGLKISKLTGRAYLDDSYANVDVNGKKVGPTLEQIRASAKEEKEKIANKEKEKELSKAIRKELSLEAVARKEGADAAKESVANAEENALITDNDTRKQAYLLGMSKSQAKVAGEVYEINNRIHELKNSDKKNDKEELNTLRQKRKELLNYYKNMEENKGKKDSELFLQYASKSKKGKRPTYTAYGIKSLNPEYDYKSPTGTKINDATNSISISKIGDTSGLALETTLKSILTAITSGKVNVNVSGNSSTNIKEKPIANSPTKKQKETIDKYNSEYASLVSKLKRSKKEETVNARSQDIVNLIRDANSKGFRLNKNKFELIPKEELANIKEANKLLKTLEKEYGLLAKNNDKLYSGKFDNKDSADRLRIFDQLKQTTQRLNELEAQGVNIAEQRNKILAEYENVNIGNYEDNSLSNKWFGELSQFNGIPEISKQVSDLSAKISELNSLTNSKNRPIITPDEIQRIQQLKIEIPNILNNLKTLKSQFGNQNGQLTNIKVQDFKEASEYLSKMKGIDLSSIRDLDGTGRQIVGITRSLSNEILGISGGSKEVKLIWNDILGEYVQVNGQTQKQLTLTQTLVKATKNITSYFTRYMSGYMLTQRIISSIRTGVNYVKEYDSALTEMAKVSNETTEALKRFQKQSETIATSIGSTAVAIQNSAADFMRLGYSLEEASKLSKSANVYANVGDMEISEATEHMISSIKAWESEFSSSTDAAERIVDKYNEIGNNYAITSADIGSAMERAAAALKAGGNTLDESIGLITAGNLIQQDAETTANALKVMSLRIRGSKTELQEMGEETDGLADSTSKLRNKIMELSGVDIMLDKDTYKSTAQIIKEIGAVFDKMTDVSQANLLEVLAGKTRASTVAGLLENYETIDKVIKDSAEAEGSANKENERYMNSIEGKMNILNTEVQTFWNNVINSDFIKEAIDALTGLLELFNKLLDTDFGSSVLWGSLVSLFMSKNGITDKILNKKTLSAIVDKFQTINIDTSKLQSSLISVVDNVKNYSQNAIDDLSLNIKNKLSKNIKDVEDSSGFLDKKYREKRYMSNAESQYIRNQEKIDGMKANSSFDSAQLKEYRTKTKLANEQFEQEWKHYERLEKLNKKQFDAQEAAQKRYITNQEKINSLKNDSSFHDATEREIRLNDELVKKQEFQNKQYIENAKARAKETEKISKGILYTNGIPDRTKTVRSQNYSDDIIKAQKEYIDNELKLGHITKAEAKYQKNQIDLQSKLVSSRSANASKTLAETDYINKHTISTETNTTAKVANETVSKQANATSKTTKKSKAQENSAINKNTKAIEENTAAKEANSMANESYSLNAYEKELNKLNGLNFNSIIPGGNESFDSIFSNFNKKLAKNAQAADVYAGSISNVDGILGEYLRTQAVAGSPATWDGFNSYLKTTVSNLKAETLASKAATLATNVLKAALMSIAIGAVIQAFSWIAEKLNNVAHEAENCSKRVEELTDNFKSTLSTAQSNSKAFGEISDRFTELASGVDALGNNISLTTDEFSEYNEMANKIAEMSPELVSGYTNEGNAIIGLKDNVDALTHSYKEAEKAAYNMLIVSGKNNEGNDIIDNFKNKYNKEEMFETSGSVVAMASNKEIAKFASDIAIASSDELIDIFNSIADDPDLKEIFFEITGANSGENHWKTIEQWAKEAEILSGYIDKINDGLLNASDYGELKLFGIEVNESTSNEEAIVKIKNRISEVNAEMSTMKSYAKSVSQTANASIQSSLSSVIQLANAYMNVSDEYNKLDDKSKSAVSQIINSMNVEVAEKFNASEDVGAYVNQIISLLANNTEVQGAILGLFDVQDDLTAEKAETTTKVYLEYLKKAFENNPETYNNLLELFGIDENSYLPEDFSTNLNAFKAKYVGRNEFTAYGEEAAKFANQLTEAELEYANSKEFEKAVNERANVVGAANLKFEDFKEILQRIQKIEKASAHTDVKSVLSGYSVKNGDEESNAETELDNYYSKVQSIQESIQKLRNGTITTSELSDLRKEYDLTSDSIEGMTKELENQINADKTATLSLIDDVIKEVDPSDKTTINNLETIKQYIEDAANEALLLKNNLRDGSTAINDIQNLKSGMDMIAGIYEDIKDKEEFDWSSIINNTEFENTFKSCGKAYNDFIEIISNNPDDIAKTQDSFNKLVTAYYNTNEALHNIKESDSEVAKQMMIDQGITKESATAYVDFYTSLNKITASSDFLYWEDSINEQKEYIDNLDDINKKYGNIDNINRSTFTYTKDIIDKYSDTLKEWGLDVSEWNDTDWSTVLGDHMTLSDASGNREIVYTMFADTGNELIPLNKTQFNNYINEIVNKATDSSGNIDMEKLMKLDATGLEQTINGESVKIKGLLGSYEGQIVDGIQLTFDDIKAIAGETGDDITSDFKGFSMHDVQAEALNTKHVLQQLQNATGQLSNTDLDDLSAQYEDAFENAKKWANGEIASLNALKEANKNQGIDIDTTHSVQALLNEAEAAGIDTQQLSIYLLNKELINSANINTTDDCQALLNLADQAGATGEIVELLAELMGVLSDMEIAVQNQNWNLANDLKVRADGINKLIQNAKNNMEFEPVELEVTTAPGTAKDSGKSDADAYEEAYKKELEKLETDRDLGLITERQFLDKWKELIEKFFKDVNGYTDQYKKEMASWQDSMLSYMNSVGGAVVALIDKRIQDAEKSRDKIIDALEEEKDAAIEAIEEQIDAIDDLIDAKNDEVDRLQDEIDAINNAADARQRDLDLMKAQYDLERAQSQRTKLIYNDSVGFHYETDQTSIRDSREEIDAAKREQEIAEIEKKIELKEKEIELLEKQKETLEKQKDEIEKYYDKLIKQQEKYWKSIIDALEETKSKWEEIMMLDELAENWGLIEEFFKESGYSVEDVINGNEGALNEFKSYYIDLLSQMHTGNEGYLNGLEKFGGSYQKIKDSATDTSKAISDMNEPLGKAAENVGKLGDSAGTAATGVSDLASGTTELKKGVDGTGDELKKVTDAVNELTDLSTIGNDFTNIANGLTEIKNAVGEGSEFAQAIDDIKNALVGQDGSGGIVNALTLLSQSEEIDLTKLNGQFKDLAEIAKTLASTLGTDGMSDGTALGTVAMANNGTEGIGGLSTSLKNLNTITLDGLIQQFSSLLDAITNVTNAIDGSGMSSESGMDMTNAPSYARAAVAQRQSKEGQSGEGGTLNDSLTNMELVGTQATNALIGTEGEGGFQGIIDKVNELMPLIGEEDSDEAGCMTGEFVILHNSADENVQPIVEMFQNLVEQISAAIAEVESLATALESLGDIDFPSFGGGFSLGGLFKYNGTVGDAFAKGTTYNGLNKTTDALTSEFGQPELIVKPNGEVELTTEPTLQKLPKDTIIFNGEQTERILKGKTKGKAFANGTLPNGFSPLESVNPIEFNKFMDTTETLKNIALDTYSNLVMMQKNVSDIAKSNSNISHNNMSNSITIGDIHITCPGVTSDEVMQQIGTALNKEFAGMALNAYQRTMKR